MFDIGGWELLLLMVIALVVVGPKELPTMMRVVGQWTGRARAMAREFQASFEEMARQAELDEIKKEVGDIAGGKELKDLQSQISKSVDNMIDPPKPIDTKEGFHPPTEDPVAEPEAEKPTEPPAADQGARTAG